MRGSGGAPRERSPAGAPVLYAPDGWAWLSRADGTRPRHLSFLASARKPWSADNSGSMPRPLKRIRRARKVAEGALPWKEYKDVDEHTTRKPMLLFRLFGLFLLRLAERALS